jgi:hypothetical protein
MSPRRSLAGRAALAAVASSFIVTSFGAPAAPARSARPRPPVIAIAESGLNVLHSDFALTSAPRFPKGIPEFETVELPQAGDFAARVAAAQKGPLGNLEENTLYWVKGTKVFIYEGPEHFDTDVFANSDHGTGVAGAAVGNEHGSYPDAWLVLMRQRTPSSWEWLAEQRWIDVVSTSYYTVASLNGETCGSGDSIRAIVEDGRIVFSSSGNYEQAGMTAEPAGFPDAYQVGGVDSEGRSYRPSQNDTDTPTRPYETGDRFDFPSASYTALTGSMDFGGTSGAAPTTAGRAADLINHARTLLGSPGGMSGDALAKATPGVKLPTKGPLSDGAFTNEELTLLLHHIATPAEEGPHRYLIEGYGALSDDTTKLGKEILAGTAEEPVRDQEDIMHEAVEAARPILNARCT